jgi:hypothetical protein
MTHLDHFVAFCSNGGRFVWDFVEGILCFCLEYRSHTDFIRYFVCFVVTGNIGYIIICFCFRVSYSLFYFSLYKLLHLAGVDLGVAFYKIREEKVNVSRPAISCLHINPIYTRYLHPIPMPVSVYSLPQTCNLLKVFLT